MSDAYVPIQKLYETPTTAEAAPQLTGEEEIASAIASPSPFEIIDILLGVESEESND